MPNGDLAEIIRGLSPGALSLFKRQLRQRLETAPQYERQNLLSNIGKIPELSDITGAPTQPIREYKPWEIPEELPGWQKALRGVTMPFHLAHEYAIAPWATAVTAPWSGAEITGLESVMPGGAAREAYEEWEAPKYVKGTLEFLPWLAMPTAAGLAGRLGTMGRAGRVAAKALTPAVKAERAITYPIAKPLEMATQKLIRKAPLWKVPEAARFIAQSNEMLAGKITKDDWMRGVAQWFGRKPFFGSAVEAVGGKAALAKNTNAVEDIVRIGALIAPNVQETLINKGRIMVARLASIHPDPIRLFGVDEATGLASKVIVKARGASRQIYDIAEHPARYSLTKTQDKYIKTLHEIEDWVLDGLKESGVEVKLLKFDEFSHWVHRVVKGKRIDGKLVELRRGFGRIGSKQSFEKTRFYETAADGLEQGIVYSPNLEQALRLYMASAAKRIGDQRLAQMVAPFGVKPTERIPAAIRAAREDVVNKRLALRNISTLIERINAKAKIKWPAWLGIKKQYPEQYAELRTISGAGKAVPESLKKWIVTEKDALKVVAKEAKAPYKLAMERAKQPSLGTEAVIAHPAFQGKIFPKEVADTVAEFWADRGFIALQKVATIASSMRTLVAAADFSAPWIQGAAGMARHPAAWGKGVATMFAAFKDPVNYQNFLVKHFDDAMDYAHWGGYIGGFEYMEAMPTLQRAARFVTGLAGKPKAGEVAVKQTYGRFEAAFGGFGDAFRVNSWKGLRGIAKTEQELFELTRHIDRMSGVMSTKGIGLGRSLRDFETSFLWFAPRYTRAGFALISDIFKGGLTGRLARETLGEVIAAGAFFYAGTCYALGQTPNFDPRTGRFMTIEITDPMTGTTRHFGIGGFVTSMVRFAADVTASAASIGENEPLDFVKLSRYDNPFIRMVYSKAAIPTGFITGMIEGKNFFGEPFENAGDYGKFLAEQVMPIAVQEMLMEEGGLAPTAMLAEEAGLRTFPRSDWEKRNIIRDRLAQAQYGMTWDEVGTRYGRLVQLQLEQASPELQEATQVASETSSKMARGEGIVWDNWKKEGQDIEGAYQTSVKLASAEFRQTGDGTTFRQKVDSASEVRRERYAARERNPDYALVYEYFQEPLEPDVMAKMHPFDLARKDYYNVMYSPDMYDEFGNYRFDERDRRETLFIQRYGQEALDYVEEYMGARWEEPSEMKWLREAREILKPYFQIDDQIWAQYPPEFKQISDQVKILERTNPQLAKQILFRYPAILFARNLIGRIKKMMRMQYPQIAQALSVFYRY